MRKSPMFIALQWASASFRELREAHNKGAFKGDLVSKFTFCTWAAVRGSRLASTLKHPETRTRKVQQLPVATERVSSHEAFPKTCPATSIRRQTNLHEDACLAPARSIVCLKKVASTWLCACYVPLLFMLGDDPPPGLHGR